MAKSWHIIAEYSHASNLITCACGWQGHAGGGTGTMDNTSPWYLHRKEMKNDPAPKGFNKKHYVYGAAPSRMGLKLAD